MPINSLGKATRGWWGGIGGAGTEVTLIMAEPDIVINEYDITITVDDLTFEVVVDDLAIEVEVN